MEKTDSFWDYNCPQFVDFGSIDFNDGADEWFDIHQEQEDIFSMPNLYKVNINKENQIKLTTPKKYIPAAKRISLDKHKPKPIRISIGEKKMVRRSVPLRVLRNNEEASAIGEITKTMNAMTLKIQSKVLPKIVNRSNAKRVEKLVPITESEKQMKDFAESLRRSTVKPSKTSNEQRLLMTKPKPFNLTESKCEKANRSTFRSLAEQVAAFQKQTPIRFRTQRRRSSTLKSQTGKVVQLKATIPVTPNLQTKNRTRPVSAISRDEEENLVLEEIKKQQFKHRPVDPKLFAKKSATKKVETKVTKLVPFNLTATATKLPRSSSMESFKTEFRAKRVPAKLFEGPQGLGPYIEIPLTNPKSPNFASKHRTERRRSSSADGNFAKNQPKYNTSKTSVSGLPNIKWEKKTTVVEPFSFDDKDKERFLKKDEKIKEVVEQEKKLAEFHAHPMPDLSVVKIPEKQVRPKTEILPFKFIRDNPGINRSEKIKQEIEEELEKLREMSKFKAGPNKVIYELPFIPEKSNKKLTHVNNFDLHTEIRSLEREEYEELMKLKEMRIEALRKELELKQEEEERLAIQTLRKNTETKANPIRHYKTVNVKPSDVPLTLPMTPNFNSKRK